MPQSRSKKIDVRNKIPATEQYCADKVGYTYLPTSKMSDEIRAEIMEYVKMDHNLTDENPYRECNCKLANQKCCTGSSKCPNRKSEYACVNCDPGCQNDPWKNNNSGFAINNNKLYLEDTGTCGWGLFALKEISRNEFLGEYTGQLSKEVSSDPDVLSYQMSLMYSHEIYIDPYKEGSAMRLCNHACHSNAKPTPYVHEGLYKCVFIATRAIKIGEQITITYNWVHNRRIHKRPACLCGIDCLEFIGMWDEEEDPRMLLPSIFANIATTASKIRVDELNEPVRLNELDLDSQENHIFGADEPVAVILMSEVDQQQLGVYLGRTLECYKNQHKLYFYVVRVIRKGAPIDYHVPMWFVFRSDLVAEVMIRKIFTDVEKDEMREYLRRTLFRCSDRISKKNSDRLEGEIVTSYIKRVLSKDIPKFEEKTRKAGAESSIGYRNKYLSIVKPKENAAPPPPHSPMRPEPKDPSATAAHLLEMKIAILNRKKGNTSSSQPENSQSTSEPVTAPESPVVTVFTASPSSPTRGSATSPIEAAGGRLGYTREIIEKMQQEYNELLGVDDDSEFFDDLIYDRNPVPRVRAGYSPINQPRELRNVIQENTNLALYRRFYQHAVETLTFLNLWLCPSTIHSSFQGFYGEIAKDLYAYYYAARVRDRRFLTLEHYRLCCEIVQPGSFNQRYCSICGMSHNYPQLDEWNLHFYRFHEIGSPLYTCDRCEKGCQTRWPSEFREHIESCCPSLLPKCRTDLPNYKLDSYAHYIALQGCNNKMRHLLKPGQAFIALESDENKEDDIPLVEFDPHTLMPTSPTVPMIEYIFEVQETHTDMSKKIKWHAAKDKFRYAFRLSNISNMRPILPASHGIVNKENKQASDEQGLRNTVPALTKPPKKLRGKYKKKVTENKKDSSSTKSSENLLVDNQASKTKRKRIMPEPTGASECQPSTSGSKGKATSSAKTKLVSQTNEKATSTTKATKKSKSRTETLAKLSSDDETAPKTKGCPKSKKLKMSATPVESSNEASDLTQDSDD